MKILFCPQAPASRELGGSKVVTELVEEMEKLGWECDIKSIPEIRQEYHHIPGIADTVALKLYLQAHAEAYDVVEYDHGFLPFDRAGFTKGTLFVARSVLLAHHFLEIDIPKPKTLTYQVRGFIRTMLNGGLDRKKKDDSFKNADKTVKAADLVNVSNDRDREILIRHGVEAEKILVLPYGIDAKRRKLFDAVSDLPPAKPKVVFVGTFDYRKGCLDMPGIFEAIAKAVPEVTFRLLGTAGFCQTEKAVRRFFPSRLQKVIEVIPCYDANDLPRLLSDCSVGIFPSYIEGFGFGVIEMLAAAIPVIAYDSPGPSSILPPKMLTPPGNVFAMAHKIIEIISNLEQLHSKRVFSRRLSDKYDWHKIALETSKIYLLKSKKNKQAKSSCS